MENSCHRTNCYFETQVVIGPACFLSYFVCLSKISTANILFYVFWFTFISFTMEATAKYDFDATADDELSFIKGQPMKVKDPAHTHVPVFATVNIALATFYVNTPRPDAWTYKTVTQSKQQHHLHRCVAVLCSTFQSCVQQYMEMGCETTSCCHSETCYFHCNESFTSCEGSR